MKKLNIITLHGITKEGNKVKDVIWIDSKDCNKFKDNLYLLFTDNESLIIPFGVNQELEYKSLDNLLNSLTIEKVDNYIKLFKYTHYFPDMNIIPYLIDRVFYKLNPSINI